MHRWHDARLVPLAVTVWGATLLLLFQRPSPTVIFVLLGVIAMALLGYIRWQRYCRRRPRPVRRRSRPSPSMWSPPRTRPRLDVAGQLVVCFLAVLLVCLTWLWHNDPAIDSLFRGASKDLTRAIGTDSATAKQSQPITVKARVVSQPKPYGDQDGARPSWWSDLAIHQWQDPEIDLRSATPVTVFARGSPPVWMSWVVIEGSLTRGGIGGGELILRATAVTEVSPAPAWSRWSDSVREATHRAVENLSEPAQVLVPGVAIGDTSQMSDELSDQMKIAGLTHLTAVSGAHFAILTAALWFVLGACRLNARPRAVLVAVALAAMVVLVRPEPSVMRAAAMAAVSVMGVLAGRRSSPLPALAVGIAVLIVVDPYLAVDIGFALSVAATVGLVFIAPIIEDKLPQRWPRSLRLQVAIACAAHVLCAPVLILIAPHMLTWSVAANLLVAPVGAVMTVLSALVAVLAVPAAPIAQAVAWIAQVPAWWIAAVARCCASAPGAQIAWPEGMVGLGFMAGTMTASVILIVSMPGAISYLRVELMPLLRWRYGRLRTWLHPNNR